MAEDWLADVRKYAGDADEGVVGAIVKYCGIALQSRDSSLVAMSDKKERDLVRENYLKKKLGLTNADADLDEAVLAVGQVMKADRTKNRVTVYYLLAEHFGLLSVFGGVTGASGAAGLAAAALGGAAMAGAGAASAASPDPEPVAAAAPEPEPAPAAAAPAYAAGNYGDDDASAGGGLGWLKWLLLAAVLAALLFFMLRSCSGNEAQPAGDATTTEASGGETADAAATDATAADATAADATAAAAVPEGSGVVAGDRNGKPMLTVYFDSGKSDVSNDLSAAAAKVKDYVAANAGAKLAVSGYNDPTGNAAFNAELSKKRAQGVGKALEAAGIPAAAIELVKPEATTDATVDKAAARRVEVTVK